MSNTSTVTPYESNGGSNTSTDTTIADVFSWLGDTDEDRAADERAKEARGRQLSQDILRKGAVKAPPVVSIKLHMKTADTLLRSVGNAGYKVVQEVPRVNTDFLVLQGRTGDRVLIEQTHGGGVRLHAARSRVTIDQIMRRHTLDRAEEHLAGDGMQVVRKELPNGEIQLLARGSVAVGKEELHVQIRTDGSSIVDVVDGRGPHCAKIVNGFAEATGGQISSTKRKDEYYLLPGKLRRERVQAK